MSNLEHKSAEELAKLLRAGDVDAATWTPEERRQLLLELFAKPLPPGRAGTGRSPGPLPPIGETLRSNSPPLPLLDAIKGYAKALREDPESGIPPDVATYVYYAAIATAIRWHGKPLTSLDTEALTKGFSWCLECPWVSPPFRKLFEHAVDTLQING
ncbi:MAG: hypothetical protein PVI86_19785 [Phycisphaerae bacterium]|jgi:hypothetical protein